MKIQEVDIEFNFRIGDRTLNKYFGKVMVADRGMFIWRDDNTTRVKSTSKTVLLTNKEVNVRKNPSKRLQVITRLDIHYNVFEAFCHFDSLIEGDWSSFVGYIRKQKNCLALYLETLLISKFLDGKLLTLIEEYPSCWKSERMPADYLDVRVEDFKIVCGFKLEKERQRLLAATKRIPSQSAVVKNHKI